MASILRNRQQNNLVRKPQNMFRTSLERMLWNRQQNQSVRNRRIGTLPVRGGNYEYGNRTSLVRITGNKTSL